MTIYGRWGQEVTMVRGTVTEQDVRELDEREPDDMDRANIANGCYVVVLDGGKERLYAHAFLRADGGWKEIAEALTTAEAARGES